MKMMILALVLAGTSAFASTPPEQVDRIDRAREGNLAELVMKHVQTIPFACEYGLAKTEITKIQSASSNQEKKPDTKYNYEANYLILRKCHTGSTYVGAYTDTEKAFVVQGSFESAYSKKGGPKKMENLQFVVVKDIDLSLPEH